VLGTDGLFVNNNIIIRGSPDQNAAFVEGKTLHDNIIH
jgi:hypothetical protein